MEANLFFLAFVPALVVPFAGRRYWLMLLVAALACVAELVFIPTLNCGSTCVAGLMNWFAVVIGAVLFVVAVVIKAIANSSAEDRRREAERRGPVRREMRPLVIPKDGKQGGE